MARQERSTSADSYFRSADGHRKAAQILYPHVQQQSDGASSVFLAFYNVLGFAIELYLKAFLANRGFDSDMLSKRQYGHQLEVLYDEAVSSGLYELPGYPQVHPSALARVVEIIGSRFESYAYRYINDLDDVYSYIETMEIIWVVLDDLHQRVRQSGITI
ncbi:hypothetical protein JT737_19335 [Sinorhizobium meliloti]|uniref:hypothetical protein n=1 Tax=Rhizobium meliloti TaxID=382 RepID=UPI002095560E|nr:hypothetical protein [Sinorhizobium meliloti]MCO6423862.1 hypothetical protein [Sinorhizobium meliloti]